MLNSKDAQKFIDEIAVYYHGMIHIADHTGTIAASKDKKRIGRFHEVAYDLISTGKREMEFAGLMPGVEPGISMTVFYRNQAYAVLVVEGDVEEIRQIAHVLCASLEAVLTREENMRRMEKQADTQSSFAKVLLSRETSDTESMLREAEKAGIMDQVVRLPVMVSVHSSGLAQMILKRLRSITYGTQDITSLTQEGNLIWFHKMDALDEKSVSLDEIREEFRLQLRNLMVGEDISGYEFVLGPPQKKLVYYYRAYRFCLWILRNKRKDEKVSFAADYLDDYLETLLPVQELHMLFHSYEQAFDAGMRQTVKETEEALRHNDYQLQKAGEELNLHKNTIAFRVQKINAILGTNCLHNVRDQEFLKHMVFFFQNMK